MTAEKSTLTSTDEREQAAMEATARLILRQAGIEEGAGTKSGAHQNVPAAAAVATASSVDGGKSYFVPNNLVEL